MSDQRTSFRDRLRGSLRARRTPDEQRAYRIANSIRVPWAVGLSAMLLIALSGGALVGRGEDQPTDVPPAILDYQTNLTTEIAQSVRRGVNEGINDLETLGAAVGALDDASSGDVEHLLQAFTGVHGRYTTVYVLDADANVVVSVGGEPHPSAILREPPLLEPGIFDATEVDDAVVIALHAPVRDRTGAPTDLTVVGEYDPRFLRFPLEPASPGDGWVVTSAGLTVGTQSGSGLMVELSRRPLRTGAARAVAGATSVDLVGGSFEELELVAYAPVSGVGPTGTLGWGIVTSRTVSSIPQPGTGARRQATLFAILLAILSITVFGWMWAVMVRPILRLQREAERLAYGDLSQPVTIERYDEIGLLARAMERMRILLLRRSAGRRPRARGDDAT